MKIEKYSNFMRKKNNVVLLFYFSFYKMQMFSKPSHLSWQTFIFDVFFKIARKYEFYIY